MNCVSLGHKSGRVLVTGGDDKKVNLWAVGKPNCIMVRCQTDKSSKVEDLVLSFAHFYAVLGTIYISFQINVYGYHIM